MSSVSCCLSQCPSCASTATAVVAEYSSDRAVCIQCGSDFCIPWYSRLLSEASATLPVVAAETGAWFWPTTTRPWKKESIALLCSLLLNGLVMLVLSLCWFQSDVRSGPTVIDATFSVVESEKLEDVEALLAGGSAETAPTEPLQTALSLTDLATPAEPSDYDLPAGIAAMAGPSGGGAGRGGGAGLGSGAGLFRGLQDAQSFAFVVDASGSMGGSRMQVVLRQLEASLNVLKDHQTFFVVFFSNRAFPMGYPKSIEQLIPANATNRTRVMEWARKVRPDSGTRPQRALQLALSLKPEVLFFLTDGSIPDSTHRLTQRLRDRRTRINTICIGSQATSQMRQIANESGGEFLAVR